MVKWYVVVYVMAMAYNFQQVYACDTTPCDELAEDAVAPTPDEQLRELLEKIALSHAQQVDINAVLLCLNQGAPATCVNSAGHTVLHLAALHGALVIFERGVACGCNINIGACDNETPLHCAARSGSLSVLNALIQRGAIVNQAMTDGNTPLHLAALYNHKACVSALLGAGASPASENDNGKLPVDLALQDGFTDVAKLLKEYKGFKT